MTRQKKVLITGSAGFIGSHAVDLFLGAGYKVLGFDAMKGGSSLLNVLEHQKNSNFNHVTADLCNYSTLETEVQKFIPELILNFAAESHVDRSINNPNPFVTTNIVGTYNLLEVCRLGIEKGTLGKEDFKIIHISTDEVYGSLGSEGTFSENSQINPSSPYSASKAASDLLALAWFKTYNIPIIVTNCSNNFGPRQNHEKLIPTIIDCLLRKKPIPVFGNGKNVRDWLYVGEHVRAIKFLSEHGKLGERYNIGGGIEFTNLEIIDQISKLFKESAQLPSVQPKINFVDDRKGHDFRYAIEMKKLLLLGYHPKEIEFEDYLTQTIYSYFHEFEQHE